ncbi:MAG: NAD(P)H-hydrate dehydratase [Planctomycetota bacterium]|nr:NAD(P)H-hydrate dehydratase [Planctomycetota bacterium]
MTASIAPLPRLTPRQAHAHKGDFGHALLVGGGPGMSGAICLATLAALRCGAGRTTVAARSHTRQIVQTTTPCAMTMPLDEVSQGYLAESSAKKLLGKYSPGTVLGIGPGLGREANQDRMVLELFKSWPGTAVIDADALNAISESTFGWSSTVTPPGHRILTPHPGEWARLINVKADKPEEQHIAAVELAKHTQMIIVLKGHRTLVTDGQLQYRNNTGNPSLAVGGSGDVLTGMIVALVCQGLTPYDASVLAVYLHGLAGDIAHQQLGTPSTLGTDLIDCLPAAFRQYRAEHC